MTERVLEQLVPARRRETARSLGVAFAVTVALLIVAPFAIYPIFLMKALCFALFACAFNLLIGYVGLVSFGHALYFGFAGYLSAYVAKHGTISFPFWFGKLIWLSIPLPAQSPALAVLVGTATAAVLGIIAGGIAIRRQGIYFAMITLALAQMMYFFALRAPFTGGEDGIQAVPQGHAFGVIDLSRPMALYLFTAAVFLFGFLAIYRTVNSPFGEILKAIRENEPRAISLGYRVARYKLAAFVLSAALAGLAGATKAIVAQNASLTDVGFAMSGEVVLMTLLGGMGTLYGPVVGALVVVSMQNYLAQFGQWVTVIQGAVFVACVLLFRRGVVGEIGNALKWSI